MRVKHKCPDCGKTCVRVHYYRDCPLCYLCYIKQYHLIRVGESLEESQLRVRKVDVASPKRGPYGIVRLPECYIGKKVRVVMVEGDDG